MGAEEATWTQLGQVNPRQTFVEIKNLCIKSVNQTTLNYNLPSDILRL